MNIGAIVKRAKKAATDNAPTILTAIGVTGTVTTAILASRASFRAAEVLSDAERDKRLYGQDGKPRPDKSPRLKTKSELADEALTLNEKIDLVWKHYVPAIGTGAVTIACIIGANRVSSTRAAALASAYSVSQELFKEYKDKVVEKLGEKKEQAVRDEISQDRVTKNPPPEVVLVGTGTHLCMDMYSGRYFLSTLEDLKKAENDTNYQILHSDYASLSDYWDNVGLPRTTESDEVGWNPDMKLEVEYGSAIAVDGRPCITTNFRTVPVRGYGSRY